MGRFQGVIFDMDGLMFDTERMMQKMIPAILADMGFTASNELFLKMVGLSDYRTKQLLQYEFGEQFPFETFLQRVVTGKKELYRTAEIPVKEGLSELLDYLDAKTIKRIVATGSIRSSMNQILERTGYAKRCPLAVCGDEVERGKPSPDLFLKGAEKLQLPPEECLVLEDSENGIRAAHAAGMSVIFIKDLVTPSPAVLEYIYVSCKNLKEVMQYC